PHVVSQIRAAQQSSWRRGLELAVARETSRAADAAARLDLLAVRRAAFRDAQPESLRRRCCDLVRRLHEGQRAAAVAAAQNARPRRRQHLYYRHADRDCDIAPGI